MVTRWICGIFLAVTIVGSATAEQALHAGLAIDEVDDAFNAAAERLKVSDFLIAKRSCDADARAACQYVLSGNLAVLATAGELGGSAEELTLLFAKDSEPVEFLKAIGIMTAVLEPNLGKEGRAKIAKALLTDFDGPDVESSTEHVRFKRLNVNAMGIWIIATPR